MQRTNCSYQNKAEVEFINSTCIVCTVDTVDTKGSLFVLWTEMSVAYMSSRIAAEIFRNARDLLYIAKSI